jgi:signal transduction histidine kinase/DNA-binding response OmpR family regulator
MEEQASLLIVDDDESTRRSLALIFSKKGYETETAETGQEALEKARERFFNVALLDIKLPDMEGVELLAPLKEMHPDMVLIIVTAYASLRTAVQALNSGASAYITKPLNMDDALAKVRDVCEKQSLVKENRRLYQEAQRELTERKRAEEALRQHLKRLEVLQQIELELTAQLDLDTLLHSIVSRVTELLGGTVGSFYLYRQDRRALELAVTTAPSQTPVGSLLHCGEGLAGKVWERGELIMVDDYRHWAGRAAVYEDHPWTAIMGVPVHWGEEFLGVLNVLADSPCTFSTSDAELLNMFAAHAAVAIANARLYEQTQARSRYLETLLQINSTLRSTLPLSQVLEMIAQGAGEALNYVGTLIAIPDATGERLTVGTAWVRDKSLEAAVRFTGLEVASLELPLTTEGNPIVQTYLSGELQVTSRDLARIAVGVEPGIRPKLAPAIERTMEAGQAVCVPLSFGETVTGVLVVFSSREQLSHEELTMLLGLADQAGLAIKNARLYEALRQELAERQRLEEQLLQSRKMEAIGQLAGGVAHDFNNILTAITGYSELLLGDLSSYDSRHADVQEIKKAADRAAALTRQLLAFSRRQVLQPTVLNLNVVISNMEKMLRRLIREDIELVIALDPELGRVKADMGQIEQVIMNLAVNARDAMPQGGKLTIETANVVLDEEYAQQHVDVQPGPYVMLAVSDTGVGMDEETRSHLFEPFFTTKEVGEGTGLGLATVYGIVKQSGGHIWVYSEPKPGTTFKVYLPRVEEAVESGKQVQSPAESPRGSETVLLVEDADMVRDLAYRVLLQNGYTVLEARDGREALQVCEEHEGPIHLLMTDEVMPQMSGRELADRLMPLRPEMRMLYMSGYTDDGIIRHGVLEPGVAFLQKPFTPDALTSKVREVLDAP